MITSAGFLEPDPGVFTVGVPVFSINGEPTAETEALEGWDYSSELRLSWEIGVDKPQLLEQCGLGPSTDIQLGFRWRSSKTTLYESSVVAAVVNGRNSVQVEVPSMLVGGALVITIFVLVMGVESHENSPLAAQKPGSILWSESRTVFLEGAGSRFPLIAVDFPAGEMQKGMWEFAPSSTDLQVSALGAFNLRVNSAHPAVRKLLEKPDASESKVLLAAIRADLNRQLIMWALREGQEIKSFDEDTIGGVLWATYIRHFPEADFEELVTTTGTSPWRVEARVQAMTAEAMK